MLSDMNGIADNWWNEDRRDLFRSLEVIASDTPNPDRIGLCFDTILKDLELNDDPQQGSGAWLFYNELQLSDGFGVQLKAAANQVRLVKAGRAAIASASWPEVRGTAAALLRLMAANEDITP